VIDKLEPYAHAQMIAGLRVPPAREELVADGHRRLNHAITQCTWVARYDKRTLRILPAWDGSRSLSLAQSRTRVRNRHVSRDQVGSLDGDIVPAVPSPRSRIGTSGDGRIGLSAMARGYPQVHFGEKLKNAQVSEHR
jgi:hypothetical protein